MKRLLRLTRRIVKVSVWVCFWSWEFHSIGTAHGATSLLHTDRTEVVSISQSVSDQVYLRGNAAIWRAWTPGVVRPNAGTIEVTVVPNCPIDQLGNDWNFILSAVPAKKLADDGKTILGVFVPPAPDKGLSAILRTGRKVYHVNAPGVAWTVGRPVNVAVTWGAKLTLAINGVAVATTPMTDTPAPEVWPDHLSVDRFGPFMPHALRISTEERQDSSLAADPASPFAVDRDTSLITHEGLDKIQPHVTRWHMTGFSAVVQPVWRAEKQTWRIGEAVVFPVVAANPGPKEIIADVEVAVNSDGLSVPAVTRIALRLPPRSPAKVYEIPLSMVNGVGWYPLTWRISGIDVPPLSGSSAIAVYPHDSVPADGAMASFYAVHHKAAFHTDVFAKLGVHTTRAWAESEVFMWYELEPTPGNFSWQRADAYVTECRRAGMDILGVLGYPPRWAAVEPDVSMARDLEFGFRPARWKPKDLTAWARYVRETVTRYKGKVRYWEIYNEVNFHPPSKAATFTGSTADYVELQRIAYREAKAADPECVMLCSGFSTNADKAMPMDALQLGLTDSCDVFNVHGYSGVEGCAAWTAEWRKRKPGAPVWMSEQMWFQVADAPLRHFLTAALPVEFAAAGYSRFFNMGIYGVFFDTATFAPTRDQWVVAVMINELRPCEGFMGLADGPGTAPLSVHHRFRRSDGSILTVLGSKQGPMRLRLDGRPDRARDLYGRPLTVADNGELMVPDLAWIVSAKPLAVLAAQPAGKPRRLSEGSFEEIPGWGILKGTGTVTLDDVAFVPFDEASAKTTLENKASRVRSEK